MPNIRFVVRPKSILGTPKDLANELGAKARYYPNPKKFRVLDYTRDFLFVLPAQEHLRNAPDLSQARQFWGSSKATQRWLLGNYGIPVPKTSKTKLGVVDWPQGRFIVRPLNHSQGKNYRITDDPRDFQEGAEYVSEVFQKTREYRVLFVYGEPLVLLRKKGQNQDEKPDPEQPWNWTQGMIFQTVNDTAGSKLYSKHKDCIPLLKSCPVIQQSHIVGVDILYRKDGWKVCEFNSCPSLQIDVNLKKIAEFINARA